MSEKKEPSDFLKKLKDVVNSGDPNKGLDAINRINEIHKLAEGMDGNAASSKLDKRLDEIGRKEEISEEEREKLKIQHQSFNKSIEDEDKKLKLSADIENFEALLNKTIDEKYELMKKFDQLIDEYKEKLRSVKKEYSEIYEK